MGWSYPSSLLNTVFYYNGKVLILREGQEHHLLKRCQFSFGTNQGFNGKLCYIEYVENGSTNRSSSYKDNVDNNKKYAGTSLGMKCHHSIIKEYFSKLP